MAVIQHAKNSRKKHILTIKWLRDHLTDSVEYGCRVYSETTAPGASSVKAFMKMVDARVNDTLVVSDSAYAMGIKSIYDAGEINLAKATDLLALGGHDASILGA